ncbi:MAG: hypothetical protein JO255_14095 [Alphaproteobacteria bacterium]|nr:hypothetical protein [Alphaproteobacteria bacterium]
MPTSMDAEPRKSTLDLINALSKTMKPNATLAEAVDWWTQCQLIEGDLDFDRRTTKYDRENLDRLKHGVTLAISAIRDGAPSVDGGLHIALVALSAIQSSIERQTIGSDGLPLRR